MSILERARAEIGTHEVAGPDSNPRILEYYKAASLRDADDDSKVPWCGAFLAWCAAKEGLPLPASPGLARSWLTWGERLDKPEVGAVAVFPRGSDPASGHVALIERMAGEQLMVLGGNQGDEVSIVGRKASEALGFRRAPGETGPGPILATSRKFRLTGWLRHAFATGTVTSMGFTSAGEVTAVKGYLDAASSLVKAYGVEIAIVACAIGFIASSLLRGWQEEDAAAGRYIPKAAATPGKGGTA